MNDKEVFHDTLVRARRRITNPDKWCQSAPARDAQGRPVQFFDASAVRYCAVAAIQKEGLTLGVARGLRVELMKDNEYELPAINDTMGHAAVLEAMDFTISRLASEITQR